VLRVAAPVFAIALVFQSGLLSDATAEIARGTEAYLANAVGMSASVEPTELNQYTAELSAKEQELAAREAALEEREIAVGLSSEGSSPRNDTTTYVLAGILFILLVLIVLNYTLDYLRARDARHELQTV
jgi:hypothetical protein